MQATHHQAAAALLHGMTCRNIAKVAVINADAMEPYQSLAAA